MQLTLPRGPRGSRRRDWPSRCRGNRNDPPHRGGALRSAEGPQLSFAEAASHESGTRSLGVLLGAKENLKRSAVLLPRTTFPRGLLGPNLFSAKSLLLRAVGVSSGSRRYGICSVKEAPLSRFSSVWSRPHLGLDFSGVKVGKDLGTVTRRWASLTLKLRAAVREGGVPLGDRVWKISAVGFVVGCLAGRETLRSSDFGVVRIWFLWPWSRRLF